MKAGLLLAFLAAGLAAQRINFDSDKPGSVPAGWTSAITHEGGAPKWEVVQDNAAPGKPNVFAQTSTDATGGRFPLAIYDRSNRKDGKVTVKFKPLTDHQILEREFIVYDALYAERRRQVNIKSAGG